MKLQIEPLEAALYLVPLPIGNREDITLRALRVLRDVDVLACEDTRITGQLLSSYGIVPKKLFALHDHNEEDKAVVLLSLVQEGKSIALCSDAGMPGISDPGFRVVRAARLSNIKVIPLPGANAALTALVGSGLETDKFHFVGFPPHKKGRLTFIERICSVPVTVILYESPHRISKLIEELYEKAGRMRRVVIARELTKTYEEFISGNLEEVKHILANRTPLKGEIVVILQGHSSSKQQNNSNQAGE